MVIVIIIRFSCSRVILIRLSISCIILSCNRVIRFGEMADKLCFHGKPSFEKTTYTVIELISEHALISGHPPFFVN